MTIMENHTVKHRAAVSILLLKGLQNLNSSLQLFFLQFFVLAIHFQYSTISQAWRLKKPSDKMTYGFFHQLLKSLNQFNQVFEITRFNWEYPWTIDGTCINIVH